MPSALAPYDIVYLIEPWVLDTPGSECLSKGADTPELCKLNQLRWTTMQSRKMLERVEHKLGERLIGLYGTSFGATANTPLLRSVLGTGGWAILENAAPPPGTPLATVLRARADAVSSVLTGWNGCRRNTACFARRTEVISNWAQAGIGDLTPADVALGLVALSTSPVVNASFIDRLIGQIDSGSAPTRVERGALRRAAAQFRLRGAAKTAQPALIGLWAGTCAAFGEAGTVPAGIAHGLATLYTGCRGQQPSAQLTPITAGDVLLIQAKNDAVVPTDLQSKWELVFPHAEVKRISAAGHIREDGRTGRAIAAWLAKR